MTSFAPVYPGHIWTVIVLLVLFAVPVGHYQLGNTVLKNRQWEKERDLHISFFQII